MRFASIIIGVGLMAIGSLAAPKASPPTDGHIRVRKEWRQLSTAERKDYIRAVKCLHTIPGQYRDIVPSSLTVMEDFAAEHKLQTPYIHRESQFLPWHRYFVWTHENTLRSKCGYKGAQPYWDYTLDSGHLESSPIFDVHDGFGGNGKALSAPDPRIPPYVPPGTGGGCQIDGPFANWTLHIALLNATKPQYDRCLTRDMRDNVSRDWCRYEVELVAKSQPNYKSFSRNMMGASFVYDEYFGLHPCGHFVVAAGGSSGDIWIGPVDPLFYLHHANLDRIWWEWQQEDLENRLCDIDGNLTPPKGFLFPGQDYSKFPNKTIALDWVINVGRLAPNVKTRELMDIEHGVLGYRYTNPREGMSDPTKGTAFRKSVQEFTARWNKYAGEVWGSD